MQPLRSPPESQKEAFLSLPSTLGLGRDWAFIVRLPHLDGTMVSFSIFFFNLQHS